MNIEQIKAIKLNFIIATARTGSSLLSVMLNTHPNIISSSEEPFAFTLYAKYKSVKEWTSKTILEFCYDFYLFSDGMLEFQFGTRKDLENILEANKSYLTFEIAVKLAYLCFFPDKDKSDITTIVDKQLKLHLYVEKVAEYYPQSKFIVLHRDPRDNAIIKWKFYEKRNRVNNLNFFRIASNWNFIYGRVEKLSRIIGEKRFLHVKYEDLVSNPEEELRKICTFLDIPFNSMMLVYDEKVKDDLKKNEDNLSIGTKNLLSTVHNGITQKTSTSKIGIWKRELKKEDANLVWSICREEALKIGYKEDENYTEQKIKVKDYPNAINLFFVRIKTTVYYKIPFSFRYLIKKIKNRKGFKSGGMTSEEFYKKTYYTNK